MLIAILLQLSLLGSVIGQTDRDLYAKALAKIDWDAVKSDIIAVLHNSREFWPADDGHYGPLMIRHAWHCAGSYRTFDGHGGCDGARQRFDPERSWKDNVNLDKAKTLLWPIKEKYGLGLSWGDLIIYTGTVAIEDMGGPVFGFCAGRIDDWDGKDSELLGPTEEQQKHIPCPVDGKCPRPLGPTTMGLIYLDPEGPMSVPEPSKSAPEVRDSFDRMGMDDMETVALIGGGHAFGKGHGACPLGPGPSPKEDPRNPWPGRCGSGAQKGKGKFAFTAGFEGPWTTTPTKWDNNYFHELLSNQWDVHVGPGGHYQWRTTNINGSKDIMMLTTDIALLHDPEDKYQHYLKLFASNLTLLEDTFARAWYKLVTRDMGPVTRCVGPLVPPPQPFQNPLPPRPQRLPDWKAVRAAVSKVMMKENSALKPDHTLSGEPYYGAVFVHLAYQCASTFRNTDYLGGCNGARIRFSPEADWPHNVGMKAAISILAPIQSSFQNLSFADLIVVAANVALEQQLPHLPLCGGRTDAEDGSGSEFLAPTEKYSPSFWDMKQEMKKLGLTVQEYVALMGKPRSQEQMIREGYYGSWSENPATISNIYFKTLLNETWLPHTSPAGRSQWKAAGKNLFMLTRDMNLLWDSDFLPYAQSFAADEDVFLATFSRAWYKLMTLDMFDGPYHNLCYNEGQM